MSRFRIFPLLFFLMGACVDPFAVILPFQKGELVVDGLITDEGGPYLIKLLYSSKPDTATLKRPTYVGGASVWIMDSAGLSEQLIESDTAVGFYYTNPAGIRGEVGKSYSLKIITPDEVEYSTEPQVLLAGGSIDRVYLEFKPKSIFVKGDNPSDAVSVFVDAQGTPGALNLFRWRWTGTYKGETWPERKKTYFQHKNPTNHPEGLFPDPEPCSGYIYDLRLFELHKVGPCTCCFCWVTELSQNARVSDNRSTSDYIFNKVEVAKVAAIPMHFFDKYHLEIEQLSLSKKTYEFWKLVQSQQQGVGSLFQPNAITVRGNVKCVTDSTRSALGVFSVSGVTRKSFFINRADVPSYLPPIDTLPIDCRLGLYGVVSTNHEPTFW